MISSVITVEDTSKHIYLLFESELADVQMPRSSVKMEHTNDKTTFHIQSKDPTAFRATMNAICKQVVIYTKLKEIQ